jgi:hypothetical protein
MKNYLFFEIEATALEVSIKVDTIFGTESGGQSNFTISDDDYVPTKGDKLYFLPGVNIPRVKMKDLTMEHGIKSIRNIDDATHIFASRNTVHKISDHRWLYRMKTAHFKEMFETVKEFMDEYYIENIETALEFYQEKYVYMEYASSSEIRNEAPFAQSRNTIDGLVKSISNSRSFYAVNNTYKSYFPAVINLTIYDEAKLLKYINGPDAVIIDSVMFGQLSDMFKSSDNDNHILAMEIMANSNYIDSLLYLEMLFKDYSDKIYNCPTKKHVNFKSLVSYLGKENGLATGIDGIMKSLIDKGVLDTEKINIIMDNYAHEIEYSGNSDFFKVKTVTVSEETLALLNTNYVYNKLEDFVPEGVTEEDEEPLELHADLTDLNSTPEVAGVATGVEGVESDLDFSDDDIETAFERIERNELKSELIELEQSENVSGSETNKTEEKLAHELYGVDNDNIEVTLPVQPKLNTNQTEEQDGTDNFEWF